MKTSVHGQVIGIPIRSIAFQLAQRSPKTLLADTAHNDQLPDDGSSASKRSNSPSLSLSLSLFVSRDEFQSKDWFSLMKMALILQVE